MFLWYARHYGDYQQIRIAAQKIADVTTGKDLLELVKIDKTRKKAIVETVGNNSIAGIMATMMEHQLPRCFRASKLPYHDADDDRQGAVACGR